MGNVVQEDVPFASTVFFSTLHYTHESRQELLERLLCLLLFTEGFLDMADIVDDGKSVGDLKVYILSHARGAFV